MNTHKVPFQIKLLQGTGALVGVARGSAYGAAFFYYTQILGLSGTLTGVALAVAVMFDAVSDPYVGSWSDNTRSALGRRHPFMYGSILPLGVTILGLLSPPNLLVDNTVLLFSWLTVFAIGTNLAFTLFSIPYTAWLAELSDDYDERTRIISYRTAFGIAGMSLGGFLINNYIFASTAVYTQGQLNPERYPILGISAALIMMVFAFITTHFTRSHIPFLAKPTTAPKPLSILLVLKEFKVALEIGNFRTLFIAMLLIGAVGGTYGALDMHRMTFFWGMRPEDMRKG